MQKAGSREMQFISGRGSILLSEKESAITPDPIALRPIGNETPLLFKYEEKQRHTNNKTQDGGDVCGDIDS